MKNFRHYTGPHYPICQYPGTRVLDPFLGEQLTQDEAIHIMVIQDPRRRSRSKNAHEGTSL